MNDSPALAYTDVGIGFGSGAGVALEAVNIVLIRGGLENVAGVILLSKKTVHRIILDYYLLSVITLLRYQL